MNIRNKLLHSAFLREAAPWALLLLLTGILAAAAAFSTREPDAVTADANDNSSVYYSPNDTASQENLAEDPMNSRIIKNYTIRLHEGAIAIFEDGSTVPLYTIETPVTHLPETDRLLLEAGIKAETLSEAYRLIEDYE